MYGLYVYPHSNHDDYEHPGLHLHDFFAVEAMKAIVHKVVDKDWDRNAETIAYWAYDIATAMCEHREASFSEMEKKWRETIKR